MCMYIKTTVPGTFYTSGVQSFSSDSYLHIILPVVILNTVFEINITAMNALLAI